MTIEIVWKNRAYPEHDQRIREEVETLLAGGLKHTDDLITHLVEIGDLESGPLIDLHGWDGKIYATYIKNPKWVTVSENGVKRNIVATRYAWPIGTVVFPSDEHRAKFPRSKAVRGTVVGHSNKPNFIYVHWDGRSKGRPIHVGLVMRQEPT